MTIEKERELFKQAYLNLRTADSIPFPDAVFDEYVRLRDSEDYKLVPLEATQEMVDAVYNSTLDSDDLEGIYKAMIGACDDH